MTRIEMRSLVPFRHDRRSRESLIGVRSRFSWRLLELSLAQAEGQVRKPPKGSRSYGAGAPWSGGFQGELFP